MPGTSKDGREWRKHQARLSGRDTEAREGGAELAMVMQQRPQMTWDELRTQLDLLLVENVPAGMDGQPNSSELRKAVRHSDDIMRLFETFLAGRRF